MVRPIGYRELGRWHRYAGSLLMCGLALLGGAAHAEGATRTWKAFTADNLWSNPANWEEGAAPVDGDDLRFPETPIQPATVVNDIAHLRVNTIQTAGDVSINGQPFTLLQSLSGSGNVVYNVHITLAGDQSWPIDQYVITLIEGLTIDGAFTTTTGGRTSGEVRMTGVLSGNGSVVLSGHVLLTLSAPNTYTGPTFVYGGRARLAHATSLGVGDGTLANGTIIAGGSIEFSAPVVLDDELIDIGERGSLGPAAAPPVTLTGPVKLTGDLSSVYSDAGMHWRGPLELTGWIEDGTPSSAGLSQLQIVGHGNLDVTGAELSVVLPNGFRASTGQAFTIIDSFAFDSGTIAGTFTGLPEGATFRSGNITFAISYTGGIDNKDVVLTVVGDDHQYYLSEGATGSFFSTDILLANPHNAIAPVTVTFLKPGGATPIVVTQTLPAYSRRTLHVNDIDGLEDATFSTVVKSDDGLPIVVERTMWWDQTGYGSHTEKATAGPSKQWFFAEGSQGFFSTFVLLTNPHPEANSATVQYLLEGAPAITRTYPLDPESRFTIDVGADSELVGKTFGMTVTFDLPGVAERAMYFGASPLWTGGHESIGVTAPSTSWYLAEGATGTFFETFVLLANPNAIPVTAEVSFYPAGGNEVRKTKVIPANGRLTINIEQEDAALASVSVATKVTAQLPLIVERSQYWPDPASQWYEAHNSFGVTELGKKWGLAEGRVGGADNAQTYILIAAPQAFSTVVKVTFLRESGIPVQKTFNLSFDNGTLTLGNERFNIAVGGPQVPEITNERFGVLIEATNPIAVERALYWDAGGTIWAAGSNATATRLP